MYLCKFSHSAITQKVWFVRTFKQRYSCSSTLLYSTRPRGRTRMALPVSGRPPKVEDKTLADFVSEVFPLKKVIAFKELPSYDDRNFYVRASKEGGEDGEKEFVVKIFNSVVYQDRTVLDGLNSILTYLERKGFGGIPRLVSSRRGHEMELVSEERLAAGTQDGGKKEERSFFVRVADYIPGELLDKIDREQVTPHLLYELGNYVGRMDSALQGFSHHGIDKRFLPTWDMKNTLAIRELLPTVTDQQKKTVFEMVLRYFEDHISPKIPTLTTGTIHGDVNGLNIIVRHVNGRYSVEGFIDFGDCTRSCYIFELGIAIGYVLVERESFIPDVGMMIKGFMDAFPLPEFELDLLYYIVLARMCTSAMVGEHQYSLEPWNTYLLTTPTKAWRVIKELLSATKPEVDRMWRQSWAEGGKA